MVCVKYSNRTNQPYPTCQVLAKDLKNNRKSIVRILKETRTLLKDRKTRVSKEEKIRGSRQAADLVMKEEAEKMLDEHSIHPLIPPG